MKNADGRFKRWNGFEMKSASFARATICLLVLMFLCALSLAAEAKSDVSSITKLSSLPPAAQATISAALGRDDARFVVRPAAGGLQMQNSRHGLDVAFTNKNIEIRRGAAQWRLAFAGYGYGDALRTPGGATPKSSANRVEYRRGGLTEWYVNGPLGLEQGFTISTPPEQKRSGPLTVALNLSGNMSAAVESSGTALTLTEGNNIALRYAGLSAHDDAGKALRTWMEICGTRLLLRVDDLGARYPVVVDPWVQVAKLTASDGANWDMFGESVAISGDGNAVVVGAPRAPYNSTTDAAGPGAAYVFITTDSGKTWGPKAKLTVSKGNAGDWFGMSVAISGNGDTVVVGAPGADSGNGAAYIFLRPDTGWADMTESADTSSLCLMGTGSLGAAVAISNDGNYIAIGLPGSNNQQGYVGILAKGANWTSTVLGCQTFSASDGAAWERFGSSVAISSDGNIVVVGAPSGYCGVTCTPPPSAAYVFVGSEPNSTMIPFLQAAKLTASDSAATDEFGHSVAISGDTIVVGAPNAAVDSHLRQGAAYIFVAPTSGWASTSTFTRKLTGEGLNNVFFGQSVAISGDTIAVGASNAKAPGDNPDLRIGAAYVFSKPATGWSEVPDTTKITAADGASQDGLGVSVTLSGNVLVAGAPLATYNPTGMVAGPGAAYVFQAPVAQNLTVSITTNPAFMRTFEWSIQKSVIGPTLVNQVGGSATFNYSVTVAETGPYDSLDGSQKAIGTITLTNPNSFAIAGVNIIVFEAKGSDCIITDAKAGKDETVPASGNLSLPYTCSWLPFFSDAKAFVSWSKDTYHTPDGLAAAYASVIFSTPTTTVNETVTATDTFNGATITLGTLTATDSTPFASATYTYPRTVNVPTSNCVTYPNTAKIVETGQTASQSVKVCGPAQTGATGSGSWQNTNGQNQIKNDGATSGVCNLTAWLRQYAPFQDLSASASCSQAATYVSNVIKSANASGSSMNAMLKTQMLSTALSVYFNSGIGSVAIDLTKICTMLASPGVCGAYGNVSASFGGATSMTISQMLGYAAGQSNSGGSMWYGNVKSVQELAKDAFEAINKQAAFAP